MAIPGDFSTTSAMDGGAVDTASRVSSRAMETTLESIIVSQNLSHSIRRVIIERFPFFFWLWLNSRLPRIRISRGAIEALFIPLSELA